MLVLRLSSRVLSSAVQRPACRSVSGMTLDNFRPRWPAQDFQVSEPAPQPPARTLPDEIFRFRIAGTLSRGTSIFYPHMATHPADLKVIMWVKINDLGLSPLEKKVLRTMVGPRFNPGAKEIKLTANKYPNRIENKRYLLYLIESLVAEARRLAADRHLYVGEAPKEDDGEIEDDDVYSQIA